ncbi:Ovochymase-1, partial [Bos mutus]
GLKYGIRAVDLKSIETVLESRFFSRISSWRNSTVGGHPWQVSLKLGGHHFCGGSLIQDDLVVTAVHCLVGLNEKQIKSLTVTAGEYNLFQKDKEEQNIPVSKIIIHPEYNRLGYMSFNIALLYLKLKVKFGTTVQPICIPHRGDKFEEGIFCMASGWGKISETSEYSNILQEVEVPIMDDRRCGAMLRGMNLPPLGRDMLCASFPDGEKDACQRDSGGPLVCRRDDGVWVLAGITSWAAGCTRVWNPFRNKQRKASPGIFSKVFVLMDFITQTMTGECNFCGFFLPHPLQLKKMIMPISRILYVAYIIGTSDILLLIPSRVFLISVIVLFVSICLFFNSCRSLLTDFCIFSNLFSKFLIGLSEVVIPSVDDWVCIFENKYGSGDVKLSSNIWEDKEVNEHHLADNLKSNSAAGPTECKSPPLSSLSFRLQSKCVLFIAMITGRTCLLVAILFGFHHLEEKVKSNLVKQHLLNIILLIFSFPSCLFSVNDHRYIYILKKSNVMRPKKEATVNTLNYFFFSTDSLNKIGSTSFPKTNPRSSAKVIPYGVCGIPPFSPQWLSRRIAGGVEACPHCWPWQVGLRFLGNHQCGGAIINSIWILTAAHCVQSKNNPLFWTIVAGDHDRTLKESTEQVRRAKHIVMHEDFDSLSYDSDIALIQLSSALEFNSVVRPVCLPHSLEPLFSSEICVVTGWGSANKDGGLASRLQQIQVPVLEREVCERTYYSAHPGGISEKMICAGFAASGGKDVGQGDSGGPLVCKHEKGPFVLYGIVSWGAGCAQPRKPGVFARVSVFLDWIQSKIKDAGPVLLQIKNKSKILTRQQLPPPTSSRDSASGPGCYSEVELEEPRGFFSSPRYPLDYRGKLECSWVLRVSPSSMAKFTVEYLLLPWSHMCQDSALIIYEENHSERRMSGKLCGRRLYPMVFMSSGPLVRVTFHSSVQGAFGINYIVFRVQGPKGSKSTQSLQSSNQEHVATCEDVILTKPAGIIQFPRNFHRTIMSCHWRLLAPINHIIRLDIISFQKQPMPLACQGDLWVYEGFGSGKKLIGN